MYNIETYCEEPVKEVTYAKVCPNTETIREFCKSLHEMIPFIEKEFDDLASLSKEHPNKVFPIKMKALSTLYNVEKPLYEWYVEKAKIQAQ